MGGVRIESRDWAVGEQEEHWYEHIWDEAWSSLDDQC